MIRYRLTCAEGHEFESWFQSAAAYDALAAAGRLSCALCGGGGIGKALMAPSVATPDQPEPPAAAASPGALSTPASAVEAALAAMRRHVEENSEYVGLNFAAEARAMHDGGTPERAIWGEAKPDEARRLLEDGVPVAPLPFMPPRKVN